MTSVVLISLIILHIEGHDQGINNEVLPQGMKSCPKQFSMLPYYEHLEIVHLFDTMHIEKNISETLWKILDGRRDKEKIVKICNDIEVSHAMQNVIHSNSDGDTQNTSALPWLLTEERMKDVKEVIEKIKPPTGFFSNTKNTLTKKGELGGVKTHV